jgi:hypothetical protein
LRAFLNLTQLVRYPKTVHLTTLQLSSR